MVLFCFHIIIIFFFLFIIKIFICVYIRFTTGIIIDKQPIVHKIYDTDILLNILMMISNFKQGINI